MTNYLSILQLLIDEDLEDPIEYHDIKYALRDTCIQHDSYNVMYNSLLSCLHLLWVSYYSLTDELNQEYKDFIIRNKLFLINYSQNELNRILSTLKKTIERYNRGECFQNNHDLLNEEIHGNIYIIRDIIHVSDMVFNYYQIEWLSIQDFINHMDEIVHISNHETWIELQQSFKEFKEMIQ
jgi:hypothetical protein